MKYITDEMIEDFIDCFCIPNPYDQYYKVVDVEDGKKFLKQKGYLVDKKENNIIEKLNLDDLCDDFSNNSEKFENIYYKINEIIGYINKQEEVKIINPCHQENIESQYQTDAERLSFVQNEISKQYEPKKTSDELLEEVRNYKEKYVCKGCIDFIAIKELYEQYITVKEQEYRGRNKIKK